MHTRITTITITTTTTTTTTTVIVILILIIILIALIDGFATPLTQPAERAAFNLRKAIDMERNYHIKQKSRSGPKEYETLQHAIAARMNSVSTYPGQQFLSVQAATALVSR